MGLTGVYSISCLLLAIQLILCDNFYQKCGISWNSEQFIENVKDAVTIAEYKYPKRRNTLVFIFDQSSCHKAFSDDALNASWMIL